MALVDVQRLVVLGDGCVGKSSLVRRFVRGEYSETHSPTLEDLHRYMFQLSEYKTFHTEILDTAGSHQFPAMRQLSIQSGKAFIVVYAVNDRSSMDEALNIIQLIKDIKGDGGLPIYMCGNKSDLLESSDLESINEDMKKNDYINMLVSAKDNKHVDQLFDSALRAMIASSELLSIENDKFESLGARVKRRLSSFLGDNTQPRRFSDGDMIDDTQSPSLEEMRPRLSTYGGDQKQMKRMPDKTSESFIEKCEEPRRYYRRRSIALTTRLAEYQAEPTVAPEAKEGSYDDEESLPIRSPSVAIKDEIGGETETEDITKKSRRFSYSFRRLEGRPLSKKEKFESISSPSSPRADDNKVKTCIEDDEPVNGYVQARRRRNSSSMICLPNMSQLSISPQDENNPRPHRIRRRSITFIQTITKYKSTGEGDPTLISLPKDNQDGEETIAKMTISQDISAEPRNNNDITCMRRQSDLLLCIKSPISNGSSNASSPSSSKSNSRRSSSSRHGDRQSPRLKSLSDAECLIS